MRILCIHGIGHQDVHAGWRDEWAHAITTGIQAWRPDVAPELHFAEFDHLFEKPAYAPTLPVVAQALVRLTTSGLFHGLVDVFRTRRGLRDVIDDTRWTAGMVAQWVALDALRRECRVAIEADIRRTTPDVICAHSLGSLIAYDLLRRSPDLGGGTFVVSFGSQIGNPAVRSVFGGAIGPLTRAKFWYNLHNAEDAVFTSSLRLTAPNFRQVETDFDIPGIADHDGGQYLGHADTGQVVWQDVAGVSSRAPVPAVSPPRGRPAAAVLTRAPQQRALLIGINDYPDPANRLQGCVNDVFLMSALLQELAFPADGIRVVLNDRATTAGIRERLDWLLDGARAGDTLFLFYSGHGAQVPAYGVDAEVDHIDECLVPYDFDWSQQLAITDDEFADLYGQLPYDVTFIATLDCCHSGGMTRDGAVRARGLTPPDDIRHRMLEWDRERQMWVPRRLTMQADGKRRVRPGDRKKYLGRDGNLRRLGRATGLWSDSPAQYDRAREAYGHRGPYVPVLLEACDEAEYAYEYRHGVESYGAFTFSLNAAVRQALGARRAGPTLTFRRLMAEVVSRITTLGYDQHPQIVCPRNRLGKVVPGVSAPGPRRR